MPLTLLTGGARSGKSALAARAGADWSGPVTFVATAEALDDDMRGRIERHRAERPEGWTTIEEPVALTETIRHVPGDHLVIVDCLTLWVSNLFERGYEPAGITERGAHAAAAAAARSGPTVVVTNEVGGGIVPADPSTRAYRDALGTVNMLFARSAARAFLIVAGRAVPLAAEEEVLDDFIGR